MATATELEENGILHNATVLHMFDKIIASDCIIKNQQKGDPELTKQGKREILSSLMEDTPSVFLTRFGSVLGERELDYFHKVGNHEIQYNVEVLRREVKRSKHRRNNRRLKAVSELTANTDYFSEEVMQERNPLLYEQTIGQYLGEDEIEQRLADSSKRSDCTLSSLILTNMSRKMVTDKLKRQIEAEECQIEEEEDEEQDEEEEKEFTSSYSISVDPHLAEAEKKMLKQEFLVAMQQSFLRGEDADFDYTSVDQNESYDDFSAMAQDDEDSYFDSEEPSLVCAQSENEETSNETGLGSDELMDTERVN